MIERFIPTEVAPVPKTEALDTLGIESLGDFEHGLVEEIAPAIEDLSRTAKAVEQKLEEVGGQISPELQAEIDAETRKIKSFFHRMLLIAILIASFDSINKPTENQGQESFSEIISFGLHSNKDSVLETQTGTGTEYVHSDSSTTRVLNYLTGRDTLPEEEVANMFKNSWKEELKDLKPSVSEDLEQIGIEEVMDRLAEAEALASQARHDLTFPHEKSLWKKALINEYNGFPRFLGANKAVYDALWKIEEDVGSPKIKIMEELPKKDRNDRAGYYRPETNTVVISMTSLQNSKQGDDINNQTHEVVFAEMAHAKQWSDNSNEVYKQHSIDISQRLDRSKKLRISSDSSQKFEYSIPGTVEYEAHEIIEPMLKHLFARRVRMYTNNPQLTLRK